MSRTTTNNVTFQNIESSNVLQEFKDAVREGLSREQKAIPPKFFYDRRGSELFEQICELEEYYQTRTERAILKENAEDILNSVGEEICLVEFGSGSSEKTRTLIQNLMERQQSLLYVPIDISGEFLRESAYNLASEFNKNLRIEALAASYLISLDHIPESDHPRLFVYLGGNIGNFPREEIIELLSKTASVMEQEDRLLLGIDLVKDPNVIEAAYNDAKGVTAEFNKNLLRRINRELNGNFDLNTFEHHAPYLPEEEKIEMRLISRKKQEVTVERLNETYAFQKGEYIHTENSQKFTRDSYREILEESELTLSNWWTDEREYFAETLAKKEV